MAAKPIPSPELLRKLLRYEPETGKLFWRRRPVSMFSSEREARRWNSRYAGKDAFTAATCGYRHGMVFGVSYKAHRVIWAIVYDAWPIDEIDHINGHRSENRLANLRSVSHAENCLNKKRSANNTSGVSGICWYKPYNKWSASIKVSGCRIHLGYFDDYTDAVASRVAAETKYGYHENHGRTA